MTITQTDLVDYSSLSRRLGELTFKRDYLLQNGAEQRDAHIRALNSSIDVAKVNLIPLEMKIKSAGILTVMLHRTTIDELSDSINSHTLVEMMQAARSKQGELYDKMKKRGKLTKENYEKREELANLILILNSMPQVDAEEIKDTIETFSASDDWSVDVSSMQTEKQKRLIQVLNRLEFTSCIKNGRIIKGVTQGERTINWNPETQRQIHNRGIWISNLLIEHFDQNEDKLIDVTRGIQAMTAERQVKVFEPEEENRFEELQREYLVCINKREKFIQGEDASDLPKIEVKYLKNEDLIEISNKINENS